ncbi:retrovirus-related pol polyprotein from transposon TNT 1-94 [Tanacetum coccineum]
MAVAAEYDEEKEVNANCILMANLQQASTSGTQIECAPVYDSDGSAEVHQNYNDNDIYNMFSQQEEYTKLLEPILETHVEQHNNSNIIPVESSVDPKETQVEQHPNPDEGTRAYHESLYNNLSTEVNKVNTVNQEKKKLKNDFKIKEDSLLDDLLNAEKRIEEQDNILVKQDKHYPSAMHDSKETVELAQESRLRMKELKKETKPANYAKINQLSEVFVKAKNVSETILIPDEESLDDIPKRSVARKFLQEVKDTIVTLQHVVKSKMTLNAGNFTSHIHLEIQKNFKNEIILIVDQIDARVINFENEFVLEAANFVRDYKYLAKEATESLDKIKVLEKEIERLSKESDSVDCNPVVLNISVIDEANLLVRTKEKMENYVIKKEKEFAELWNKWAKKCDECKYDKISYDKSYNDMKQKIKRLQALLGEVKGKGTNTSCVPRTTVVKNDKVIAPGMFRIDTSSHSRAIDKKDVNSNKSVLYKSRRPQPRSNTKNDRVPSASRSSCINNTKVEVEEHLRNLSSLNNQKHCSSECNNIKLAIRNDKSDVICAKSKKCWIPVNHDACVLNYVNGLKSREKPRIANVSNSDNHKKQKAKPNAKKNEKLGSKGSLAKPRRSRTISKWLPTGTVRFGNDHVASILGFGDLHWGNIIINKVSYVDGLGHNLFSVGQFCNADLEVAFRRNTFFVRNLEGVDLLKGNGGTNLYTINLFEMLSHLNFDTINQLAKDDLVTGLHKLKYSKDHLCPSCEQGKSKKKSYKPKPVPNSKNRLHLLHMDLCGPMRIKSINGKRYVLVIVDDYSRYTWIHFLASKDEAPGVIITFLKKIMVLLQAPVFIVRTDNGTEFTNKELKEYFDAVGISHQTSNVRTPEQNGVVERRNRTLVEAARTMLLFFSAPLFLWAEAVATACYTQNRSIIHARFNNTPYELINGRKPDISFLHVFGALCYPKNDREDIGKLGAKGLTLNYAPSAISTLKPTERDLEILFRPIYDEYMESPSSDATRTAPAAPANQN